MFISKKNHEILVNELIRNNKQDIQDMAIGYDRKIRELQEENDKLKKLVPYKEYLKSLYPWEISKIAKQEYGISNEVLSHCDNKADMIQEIMYARKRLNNIKSYE